MAQYSIKDLERLSGIQAHTIRIWEKRYKLVNPERTSTNIRIYSDNDLKRLLNIALLNKNGLKISKIAKLDDNDLNDKIIKLAEDFSNTGTQIENLVISMIELNELKFEKLFNSIINQLGFESAVINVVYPFLERIGILWLTGNINPAQEHFVSNLIRRKLFIEIEKFGPLNTADTKQKFVMFLPEGEYHEISLLFYTYILRKNGYCPIYLGQSVPFNDLVFVQREYNAGFLFSCFTTQFPDFSIDKFIETLSKTFKKQKIFITGRQVQLLDIKRGSNMVKIKSPEHFIHQLHKIK